MINTTDSLPYSWFSYTDTYSNAETCQPSDINVKSHHSNANWLLELRLTEHEKQILESKDKWLNDKLIDAAQSLLQVQSKGKIFGWQSTLYIVKRPNYLKSFHVIDHSCNFFMLTIATG